MLYNQKSLNKIEKILMGTHIISINDYNVFLENDTYIDIETEKEANWYSVNATIVYETYGIEGNIDREFFLVCKNEDELNEGKEKLTEIIDKAKKHHEKFNSMTLDDILNEFSL